MTGLGDHVPAFLLREFRPVVEEPAGQAELPDRRTTADLPGPEEQAELPTAEAAPKPPRRTVRRTTRRRNEEAVEQAPAA